MNSVEKWAEKIYDETDFGKSISVSISGAIGLSVYFWLSDWVVAAFSTIIVFPLFRILTGSLHARYVRHSSHQRVIDEANIIYNKLCDDELDVVKEFVLAGGCVLTWSQVNRLPISSASIETLLQRGVLHSSVMADGMTESFVLDTNIFDIGVKELNISPKR
ncbi:MAG: hypothetical protein ACRDA9_04735 [Plesiomonas shigelloides]